MEWNLSIKQHSSNAVSFSQCELPGRDRSTTTVRDSELTRGSVSQNSYETTSLWTRDSNYDIAALIGFRWNFYQGGVNNANADSEFNRSKSFEFEAEAARDRATDTVRTTINALDSSILELLLLKQQPIHPKLLTSQHWLE